MRPPGAVACALVLVLAAGCAEEATLPGAGSSPAPTTAPGTATLVVRRVLPEGPIAIEGSAAFARLEHDGDVVFEEAFDLPTDPQPLVREVPPATYTLVSYQRSCDPSACSEVGPEGWGPPGVRCRAAVTIGSGERVTATVRVTSRRCSINATG